LTENQWARILEEGGDEEDIATFREANKRRRARRAARAGVGDADEEEDDEQGDEGPKTKRRKRDVDEGEDIEGQDVAGGIEGEKGEEDEVESSSRRAKRKVRTRDNQKRENDVEKESEKVKQAKKRAKKIEVSPEQAEFNAKCMEIWNIIRQAKDDATQRIRSEIFLVKPSRRMYPDYYEIIAAPIDLTMIRKSIETSKYAVKDAYKDDFLLLFKNAQEYNTPESQVYADAVFLQDLFLTELVKRLGE